MLPELNISEMPEGEENLPVLIEEELSYSDCMELIACMNRFKKRAEQELDAQVKIYTSEEYSQEFLRGLLQKKG